MNKIQVSKLTFTIANAAFYFILFCGLTWQVTQISINYFKFSVVSNIEVILPGIERPKAINICYDAHDVRNESKYLSLRSAIDPNRILENFTQWQINHGMDVWEIFNYFSPAELLDVTYTSEELFPGHVNGNGAIRSRIKFALEFKICYQLQTANDSIVMNAPRYRDFHNKQTSSDQKVSGINTRNMRTSDSTGRVTLTEEGIYPAHRDVIDEGRSSYTHVSSYFYEINRLSYPYVDRCIDHTTYAFRDKQHAFDECVDVIMNNVYNVKSTMSYYVNGGKWKGFSYPFENVTLNCEKIFINQGDDCHKQNHFITRKWQSSSELYFQYHRMYSKESSYVITSQAKIDDIDFITYIFGAMGTWFGFSFLMCNPLQLIMVMKKQQTCKTTIRSEEVIKSDSNDYQELSVRLNDIRTKTTEILNSFRFEVQKITELNQQLQAQADG